MSSTNGASTITADETSGVLLIGGLISFWLFGIQTLQAYIYFDRYPNDSLRLKAMVVFLCSIDTLHTIFTGHMLYYFAITERLQTASMRPKAWSFNSSIALTAIVAFTVQCFVARRVWTLNRSNWQRFGAVLLASLSLAPLALGVTCTTIMVFIQNPELYVHCTVIISTWIAGTAVMDILMAGLLSHTLYHSRIGVKETDTVLKKIIAWVVNTAILTSGLAFADLATFWTLGNHNLTHWALNINLSKVYVNTVLATLNARKSLAQGLNGRPTSNITNITFRAKTPFQEPTTTTIDSTEPADFTENYELVSEGKNLQHFQPADTLYVNAEGAPLSDLTIHLE
ncbi:hypothetical protein JAAARDRAFT_29055 [Jaapia argillacea MUCL 33604]|uniref:DUF6534 domain-containing protein n=1 Tax=Jaapia argillacea MUCL 33604 TaxID=933084 RepID=A0A067QKA5_9AGAM|nr:hypothetical protein JAAARDRAFT_29055 [Jaapia argillacea MUCL 33604]